MKKLLLLVSIFIIATANTAFAEENYATRLDALYKISNKNIIDNPDLSILKNYNDYDVISELSEDGQKVLAAMVEKGIINGYEDNTLRPRNTLTRAEYAVIIYRAHEYLGELESYGKYITNYSDVVDWNKDAVDYCMEHGLMMGYGNKFGCDDLLTSSQLDTIYKRRINGLSTIDKYTILSFKNEFPLDMVKVKASARELIPADASTEIHKNANEDIKLCENYIDTLYNFDYKITNTEERINNRVEKCMDYISLPPDQTDREKSQFLSLFKENLEKEYYAECFFITTPELYRYESAPGYRFHEEVTEGYIYFKINNNLEQAKQNTYLFNTAETKPDIELGKWYRRRIEISEYHDRGMRTYSIKALDAVEEVPSEFYN